MQFPQYRKLVNGKSLYKVISEMEFIEIQFIGSRKIINHFKISQYPDKLFLQEVISVNHPYVIAREEEVENFL
jgi:hypothetical protein